MTGFDELTGGGGGQTPVHPEDLEGLRHRWISTKGQLDELERHNVAEGRRWALGHKRRLDDVLDDAFLRELHRRAFGNVYSWAGQYRTRATSIGIEAFRVAVATRDALLDTRAQLEVVDSPAERATVLARTHHAIAWIHPFANGNGRTARLFVDVLARSCDHPLPSWGQGHPGARELYLDAIRAADGEDVVALERFMWS